MKRPTLACAHRGLSAEEPENTLSAFRAAIEAGAQAIELDVRLSHDKQIIIMHDANIARTTDGVGRIGDLDLKELKEYRTADGPIPTLEEALEACADWDGVWDIELKDNRVTDHVIALIEERGMTDRVVLTSMDPAALESIQHADSDISRGLIALGPPDAEDMQAANDTGCDWMMMHQEYVTANIVHAARKVGRHVGAWTVNEPDRAKELVGMGVHMVITDRRDVLQMCCN